MNGTSRPVERTILSASKPVKSGMLKSEITASHFCRFSAASTAAALSTRSCCGSNPPRCRLRIMRLASSSESSTTRTLIALLISLSAPAQIDSSSCKSQRSAAYPLQTTVSIGGQEKCLAHDIAKLGVVPGLAQVFVDRPGADRIGHRPPRRVARQQHAHRARVAFLHLLQKLDAADRAQAQVGNDDIDGVQGQQPQALLCALGSEDPAAHPTQQ